MKLARENETYRDEIIKLDDQQYHVYFNIYDKRQLTPGKTGITTKDFVSHNMIEFLSCKDIGGVKKTISIPDQRNIVKQLRKLGYKINEQQYKYKK